MRDRWPATFPSGEGSDFAAGKDAEFARLLGRIGGHVSVGAVRAMPLPAELAAQGSTTVLSGGDAAAPAPAAH